MAASKEKLKEQAEKLGVKVDDKMSANDLKEAIRAKRAEAQAASQEDSERTAKAREGVKKPSRAAEPQKPKSKDVEEKPNFAVVNTAFQINIRFKGKDYVGTRFVCQPEEAADLRVFLVDRFGKDVLKK